MNNIKTVEVIKALPGLEVGDILTRNDGNSNFELNVEEITETYSAKRHISISQTLLNKEEFKAIEWFNKIEETWHLTVPEGKIFACNESCGIRE